MNRVAFLVLLLRAVLVRSGRSVSCYLGETAVLPSGADPSWVFSKIEWSVFTNTTWIATYRPRGTNTMWVPRYGGRLDLNTSTGDLTIRNVTSEDKMEYTVLLRSISNVEQVNKVELIVRKHLRAPDIQTVSTIAVDGGCLKTFRCSSPDAGVDLSWLRTPPGKDMRDMKSFDRSSFSSTLIGRSESVEIICTSSANTENSLRAITANCDDVTSLPPSMTPQQELCPRQRTFFWFFVGGLVGGGLAVMSFCCRGTIQSVFRHLKGKLCPSRDETVIRRRMEAGDNRRRSVSGTDEDDVPDS